MGCGSSNTLVIGRPSKPAFEAARCSTGTKTSAGDCGSNCSQFLAPHGRTLGPRKHREKTREDIKDFVLSTLGAPVIKIELDSQQLDIIVDYVLKIFEDYAPPEYFDYCSFWTSPGKSVYKLPDDVGVVKDVYYKKQATFAFQAQDLGGSIPIEYFYPGGAYASIQGGLIDPIQPIWGRAGEWVLYKQYEQMYARISSQIGGWEWISDMGYVKLYPTPCHTVRVFVHYLQKCKDWKEATQPMCEGALAWAMVTLGNVRGKYLNPPGAKDGMQLDHEFMRTKGWELWKTWKEELNDRFSGIAPITMD